MNWKNLPYWLKGGIIGITIVVIAYFTKISAIFYIAIIPIIPLIYLLHFLGIEVCRGEFCSNSHIFTVIFFVVLGSFIIGLVIGWIYGKLKSK